MINSLFFNQSFYNIVFKISSCKNKYPTKVQRKNSTDRPGGFLDRFIIKRDVSLNWSFSMFHLNEPIRQLSFILVESNRLS